MEHQPPSLKCPFRHTLITRDFGCENGQEVTYREGPGIACADPDAHQRCTTLFDALKAAALPAFDVADDLTEMPASVISKIQYGGLVALSGLVQTQTDTISNINVLVISVMDKYKNVEQLDYDTIVPLMRDYRLRKRRKG